jgi:hypothetical protein
VEHSRLKTAVMENAIDIRKRIEQIEKEIAAAKAKLADTQSPNEHLALKREIAMLNERHGMLRFGDGMGGGLEMTEDRKVRAKPVRG